MLKTYEAIYENNKLTFLNEKPQAKRAEVYLTIVKETLPANGDSLASYAGCLSDDDAEEIMRAIEEGCETIRPEDWNDGKVSF